MTNREILNNIYEELKKNNLEQFMSKLHTLRCKISRKRNLSLPKTQDDLQNIPLEYEFLDGEIFNVVNILNQDSKRVLMFMKNSGESILKEASSWHSDGTFDTSTKLF